MWNLARPLFFSRIQSRIQIASIKCLSTFTLFFPPNSGLLKIHPTVLQKKNSSVPTGKPVWLIRSQSATLQWGCSVKSSVLLNLVCKCFLLVCNCICGMQQRSKKQRRINKFDLLSMQRWWRQRAAFFHPAACGYWLRNMKIQVPLNHLSHCLLISASVVLNKTLISVLIKFFFHFYQPFSF